MDFTSVLKTVAPWIGTALGGPLGGMAVTAAANALGLTDKTTDAIKSALGGATPEQMLALKQADQTFSLQMQELGFKQITDLEGIAAQDRKDARLMQTGTRSRMPAILSTVITVGFLGLLTGMMSDVLHAVDNQAMLIMLGALGVAFGQVINFWLGSTSESGRKTELIAQAPATPKV
jgi:hypothetical protein